MCQTSRERKREKREKYLGTGDFILCLKLLLVLLQHICKPHHTDNQKRPNGHECCENSRRAIQLRTFETIEVALSHLLFPIEIIQERNHHNYASFQ